MACLYRRRAIWLRQRDADDDVKTRILAERCANPSDFADNAVIYIISINGDRTSFRLSDYPLDVNSTDAQLDDGVELHANDPAFEQVVESSALHNTTTLPITYDWQHVENSFQLYNEEHDSDTDSV